LEVEKRAPAGLRMRHFVVQVDEPPPREGGCAWVIQRDQTKEVPRK